MMENICGHLIIFIRSNVKLIDNVVCFIFEMFKSLYILTTDSHLSFVKHRKVY